MTMNQALSVFVRILANLKPFFAGKTPAASGRLVLLLFLLAFAAKQKTTPQIDKEAKKKKKTRKWDSDKTSTTQYKRDQNEGFALDEDEEISSDVEDFVDDIIIKSFHFIKINFFHNLITFSFICLMTNRKCGL